MEMSVRTISDAYVVSLARMWMFVASSIFVVVCVSVVAVVRLVPVRVFECLKCEREREREGEDVRLNSCRRCDVTCWSSFSFSFSEVFRYDCSFLLLLLSCV